MAVTSDVVGQGTLSTGTDTLRTGTATEHHVVTFYNTDSSPVTITIYLNGNTHPVAGAELDADGGFCIFECKLGSGDTLDATASTDAVVEWSDEMDRLA